jgi:hypothetical protein
MPTESVQICRIFFYISAVSRIKFKSFKRRIFGLGLIYAKNRNPNFPAVHLYVSMWTSFHVSYLKKTIITKALILAVFHNSEKFIVAVVLFLRSTIHAKCGYIVRIPSMMSLDKLFRFPVMMAQLCKMYHYPPPPPQDASTYLGGCLLNVISLLTVSIYYSCSVEYPDNME